MNQGKYVFAQLAEFLPKRVFDGMVEKFHGYMYVKHFTFWNQLLSMILVKLPIVETQGIGSLLWIPTVTKTTIMDSVKVSLGAILPKHTNRANTI